MYSFQKSRHIFSLLMVSFLGVAMPLSAEAGLLSTLAKLGKKVDVPEAHVSAFRFTDELVHYPKGSVAEVSFNHGQDQWLVKMPDGKSISVEKFAEEVTTSGNHPTLFLSERNMPPSLGDFRKIPDGVAIKIKSRNGKVFSFKSGSTESRLVDRNVGVKVTDMQALKDAIWQLQRPAISPNSRLVRLANDADAALPVQSYGSKIPVDSVGVNQLHNAIASMRQQSLVIAAPVKDCFLIIGKQKISIADLEAAAAQRDVSLIILDSPKPKKSLKSLQRVAESLQQQAGTLGNYSTGDFYNLFFPEKVMRPADIAITPSGQLRDALHVEYDSPSPKATTSGSGVDVVLSPVHSLVRATTFYRPNEARAEELDDRIHPLVPSWIHIALIISLVLGMVAFHTSWLLFKRVWAVPLRSGFSNWFLFVVVYLLHKLVFVLLYLPLLGFISPLYLTVVWMYRFANFFLFRPARWLYNTIR